MDYLATDGSLHKFIQGNSPLCRVTFVKELIRINVTRHEELECLNNDHRIAVTVEPVFLGNGFAVGFFH